MHSTHLRREHIHGLLIGVAIGDALGYAREGLPRRVALKMFGRPPLHYRLLPGRGIYSDDTQLMLMAAQAMVQSQCDCRLFTHHLRRRLRWYPLGLPIGVGKATLLSSLKCWLRLFKVPSGMNSAGNGPATRAIFCAVALNGTGQRLSKWVEESVRVTHNNQLAVDGCQILAALAKHASEQREAFDPQSVISQLMELSVDPLFKKSLGDAAEFLQNRRSPAALARHLGWDYGVSGYIVPTTIMSAYCFLRYPGDFRRAVESAIVLGGDADSIGAIVGGLSGSLLGYSQIPAPLIERIGGGPHGPAWIKKMAERLSHWPHGVDDLHAAPALPAYPSMQLIRNTLTIPLVLCHVGLRLPFRMMTRRTPRRDRN